MAAAPTIDQGSSGLQLWQNEPQTPKSVDTEVTIAILPPSITPKSLDAGVTIALLPPSMTSPPAPFTPSPKSTGKRKRLMPSKYGFPSNNAVKKRSTLKPKAMHKSDLRTPDQISPTMIRAGKLLSTLGNDHPSFIKTMVKSHVVSCFWMGLPLPFCRSFLPKQETLMVIEDENGEKCNVKYLAHKFGLSGGWRQFAIDHKLVEGDVLIFQLVESCKFKVYTVRANANELKEVDGAHDPIIHNAHTKHTTRGKMAYKRSKSPTVLSVHSKSTLNSESQPTPNPPPQKVNSHIMVNNRCIDSELSDEILTNYHKLCIAKKQLLHENLPEGLYYKLVAGMIGETVNIANEIKHCKPTTTKEEFDTWDSSLRSFELLGMKVGFLRDRIRALAKLAVGSKDAKRYAEVKGEKEKNVEMIRVLEGKIVDLKESNRKIDGVLSGLKEKVDGFEVLFQEKVDSPW